MAEIVNLRSERKARARAAARAEAAANAARFGRSRAEKVREAAEAERARSLHEAHRRDLAEKE
ncbi:MAG: DUF4169 family protein [Rhodobacteraceae bacterium]|jgi:hypothetical protein|nr:DUF4169 family protein [Paracoccaceae bacterium]